MILNLIFIIIALLILLPCLRNTLQPSKLKTSFPHRFIWIISGIILFIISVRFIQVTSDDDARMRRLRKGADYYTTILHKRAVKGRILDRNSVVLAVDLADAEGKGHRVHPQGEAFSHLLGNVFPRGKLYSGLLGYGLEEYLYPEITGVKNASSWKGIIRPHGEDVYLTIDAELQRTAFEQLDGRYGAVVAIVPETGEILVMAVSPSFNNDSLYRDDGSEYTKADTSGSLLNRTVQGRYTPGSTFKVVTATAALENGMSGYKMVSKKEGFKGDSMHHRIREHNLEEYGEIGLHKAFKVSSNQYFASIGLELGQEKIQQIAEDFGFNRTVEWNSKWNLWNVLKSAYPEKDVLLMNADEIASSSIGQYGVAATPLQMCLAVSAAANEGVLMKPQLELGQNPVKWRRVMSFETSRQLRKMMQEVVGMIGDDSGTGTLAQIPGLEVGGKTGTAQVAGQKPHAWFVSIAPPDKPRIAIAVILENAGYGGVFAAPIAKKILESAEERGYFD